MNEKIENLKKQCYISLIDRDDDMEYDMEKFAELIIEDVCKSINQLDVWMDWTQPAVGHILTDKLKKHYGIEIGTNV